MNFALEKDMHRIVSAKLPCLLGMDNGAFAVAHEIPLTYRVADIGIASIGNSDFENKQALLLRRLDTRDMWTISEMLISPILYEEAMEIPLVEKLIEHELFRCNRVNRVVPTPWLLENLGPTCMVEIKLVRWQDALEQAIFYRDIADFSCVVMDASVIEGVSMGRFKEAGVGLYSATQSNLEPVIAPRRSRQKALFLKYFHRIKVLASLSATNSSASKWDLRRM